VSKLQIRTDLQRHAAQPLYCLELLSQTQKKSEAAAFSSHQQQVSVSDTGKAEIGGTPKNYCSQQEQQNEKREALLRHAC
jgi:hypothetical protein